MITENKRKVGTVSPEIVRGGEMRFKHKERGWPWRNEEGGTKCNQRD